MPFKSKKQKTWMQINKPEMYKDWVHKYGGDVGGGGVKKTKKEQRKGK